MTPCRSSEKSIYHTLAANSLVLLAAVLGAVPLAGAAEHSRAAFPVTINLSYSGDPYATPNTALCRSSSGIGTFGSTLTVVCSSGAIVGYAGVNSSLPWVTQDSPFRYLISAYSAGQPLGVVDSYTGVGTFTTWRMISLDHQDYLEMMVHW